MVDEPKNHESSDESGDLPVEVKGTARGPADGTDNPVEVEVNEDGDGDAERPSATTTPAQPPQQSDSSAQQAAEIGQLKKEKDELYDRLLRKHADFENFRKRAERDKKEYRTYALSEFITEMLVILDNFERALSHTGETVNSDYRKGVELIYRQFRDLLHKKGLRTIEAMGHSFDPNFHEAIFREERNDLPENTILEELQKGYFFHDKLLRPAMVKVSYRTAEADAPGDAAAGDSIVEENINVE